ncbi:MAG: 3-deoxy-8-phosphooctulonate synthase [Deferribacteres bacterium]|nr:3-deoxy-8-phosphooctulonate synthase [candidate division KSB1 bacterium]MCB9500616.1 3-deoxy-8-phosphooctulonate synthase [Deferribacteres bacterium]
MTQHHQIKINDNVTFANDLPFALIAGPCQLESRDHALKIADFLVELTKALQIPFVYKSSFDKANRSSAHAKRGIGLEKALPIFQEIKDHFGCPVLTDIHTEAQCEMVAEVVDILQIPAFLCRQTDLVVAAARTGKVVNIKKGQFLAPWDVGNIVKKVESVGNQRILLTERGTSFGYNTLIVDPRALPIMQKTGYPVIIDATHAVQQPGGMGDATGGDRKMAPVIARSAVANGVAGVFIETHDDPDNAPSDGPNMIPLDQMPDLLHVLKRFDELAKENPIAL